MKTKILRRIILTRMDEMALIEHDFDRGKRAAFEKVLEDMDAVEEMFSFQGLATLAIDPEELNKQEVKWDDQVT